MVNIGRFFVVSNFQKVDFSQIKLTFWLFLLVKYLYLIRVSFSSTHQ